MIKIQLTCYPSNGSRYIRHLDAYVGSSTRRVTCLYYLNPEYNNNQDNSKLGGIFKLVILNLGINSSGDLRLFHHDSDEAYTDLPPVGM
jgi:hypothetical protein